MNYVISFSGGKDSTAMALLMLEKGEPIHSVVAFDTGWEFPAMLEHWCKFEQYTGLEVVRIKPREPFDYWLFDRPVIAKKGTNKGHVHRFGNGWPSPMRRWCTREKVNAIRRHLKTIGEPVSCIGFAADETRRAGAVSGRDIPQRYPLIEWDIDEAEALQICKHHGFTWGGLYDHFRRVSCFCCPLQRIGELRTLRREFPELWQQMLAWDARCKGKNPGFRNYESVHDLERRFCEEDKQSVFVFGGAA